MKFRTPGADFYVSGPINPREEDPVEHALRMMEAEAEGDGWDQPARLYFISLQQGVGLVMQTAVMPPDLFDVPPEGLHTLSDLLATDEDFARDFVEKGFLPDNLFGVAFIAEGWMIKGKEEEMVARMGEHPSEAADRIETRTVVAITAGHPVGGHGDPDHDKCGDFFMLLRERGQIPEFKKETNIFHRQLEDLRAEVPNALAHVFVQAMRRSRRDPVVL
jgi:hypothetical protein